MLTKSHFSSCITELLYCKEIRKDINGYSASLVIKEMQIKMITKYYFYAQSPQIKKKKLAVSYIQSIDRQLLTSR